MSISSQYLEELSRRYKRQMEEMQEQFNVTIHALNRTSQIAYERDLQHLKHIEILETKLLELTNTVSKLADQQDNLLSKVVEHHLILFFVEIAVLLIVFLTCARSKLGSHQRGIPVIQANGFVKMDTPVASDPPPPSPHYQYPRASSPTLGTRRRSLESLEVSDSPTKHRRRLSSEREPSGKVCF